MLPRYIEPANKTYNENTTLLQCGTPLPCSHGAQIFSNTSGWGHPPPCLVVSSRSCRHWAVRVVDQLFMSLVGSSCCCFMGPCMLFGPPGCCVTCPAVVWAIWLLHHPPCCHFTCLAVVWAIQLLLYPPYLFYPCCGIPPGHHCAVVASQSSLHRCGHPGCTFVTILVAPLLLSLLCRCCIIVVILVA